MSNPSPAQDGLADEGCLMQALRGPTGCYVEAGLPPGRSRLPLRVVLSTASAYRLPVAAAFTHALQALTGMPDDMAMDVEVALHEAVANAIVHGNLGIASEGRDTPAGLAAFCRQMSERLSDPASGRRAVVMEAWWSKRRVLIGVTDEGDGFELDPPGDAGEAAHGRGIVIMRAISQGIAWNQRRRRLVLSFPGVRRA